jgi:hypothetical protein
MVAGSRRLVYFYIKTTAFHLLTIQSKYILSLSPRITTDQHNTGIRKKNNQHMSDETVDIHLT